MNDPITLSTLNDGALEQMFQRALDNAMLNIADVSTPSDTARTITLEVKLQPFPDRRGATTSVSCKEKLQGVEASQATLFFARKVANGPLLAFGEDPRQAALFEQQPTTSDSKQ